MPTAIDRHQVGELLAGGARLVEPRLAAMTESPSRMGWRRGRARSAEPRARRGGRTRARAEPHHSARHPLGRRSDRRAPTRGRRARARIVSCAL